MAEFRKNKKISNFLYSKPVLIILAVIVLFFAYNIFGIAQKQIETGKNKDIALAKVTDLKQEQTKLSAGITKLQTPEGVDDAVREKFRVVKDGEGLIVITDNTGSQTTPTSPSETGFWAFLKGLFK